jgi:hypothetical protein
MHIYLQIWIDKITDTSVAFILFYDQYTSKHVLFWPENNNVQFLLVVSIPYHRNMILMKRDISDLVWH